MAVSVVHYLIIRDLFKFGVLPRGGALLELGEANWYNDIQPIAMVDDIRTYVTDPIRRAALVKRLTDAIERADRDTRFDVVKVFYELFFAPSEVQAIDPHGTDAAHSFDLNYPIELDRRFDVVINHGTAEHIFNIAQVFETIHRYTVPGGLMIHESPFRGWTDHGFYNLQPTLFFDVAEQNQYQMIAMLVADIKSQTTREINSREELRQLFAAGQIAGNSTLFTIMRRGPIERNFEIPMQGCYPKGLRESASNAARVF
jgi:hypothetical protein